jgi:hypothetical protein
MKRAILVGINYSQSPDRLTGCINDVTAMELLLETRYLVTDITMLTETQATNSAITKALTDVVARSVSGDTIIFHYSGHGDLIDNNNQSVDPEYNRMDQAIVPIDRKKIRDDDLSAIFSKVKPGVHVVAIMDCCHSGSILDSTPQDVINAAPKAFDNIGVVISASKDNQTSADATFNGKPMGMLTHMLIAALEASNYTSTYAQLVLDITNRFTKVKVTQIPVLSGNRASFNNVFLTEAVNVTATKAVTNSNGIPVSIAAPPSNVIAEAVSKVMSIFKK